MSARSSLSNSEPVQTSLFGDAEAPDAYRKAVQVLHSKPKSPLTLLQRKIGNAWLKHAIKTESDSAGWWEISTKTLSSSVGFDSKNHQYLREAAYGLMSIVFEWDVVASADKRVQWKASVLFPEVEITSNSVRYQVSRQMREKLLNPDVYAIIDLTVVRRFRRAASLAIWEFCVRFEKIGLTAEIGWEQFRDMILGETAESKTYGEYKYFKSRVLTPAITEICAASNHTIELVEVKDGRRVSMLRFRVRKKQATAQLADADHNQLIAELVKFGLPQSEARRLCAQESSSAVKAALDYTQQRIADKKLTPLANPAAYFRHALQNKYAVPVESIAATPRSEEKKMDVRAAFNVQRANDAKSYFEALDDNDQAKVVADYNAQQQTAPLRIGKRRSKAAETEFLSWLAMQTWGEPTADELLEFASSLLGRETAQRAPA